MLRLALRVACPAAAGAALLVGGQSVTHCRESRGLSTAVHSELSKLRPDEVAMRRKWEEDEEGFHKLPPRAWPPKQPKADELPELRRAVDGYDLGQAAACLSPQRAAQAAEATQQEIYQPVIGCCLRNGTVAC